jgi:hypothetical protein
MERNLTNSARSWPRRNSASGALSSAENRVDDLGCAHDPSRFERALRLDHIGPE